jgi:hypothetical protein
MLMLPHNQILNVFIMCQLAVVLDE